MKSIVGKILEAAQDTKDPKAGSVFEKEVKADIADFDVFMKTVYPDSKGLTSIEGGVFLLTYYDENKGHVGTYNLVEETGWFGGSRIGSENLWRKLGDSLVKNPFTVGKNDGMQVMKYSLVGVNGNAYSVMSYVSRAMRECRKLKADIDAYFADAKSADYNHLLAVSIEMVDKLNAEIE